MNSGWAARTRWMVCMAAALAASWHGAGAAADAAVKAAKNGAQATANVAPAADAWAQLRGPNGQGQSDSQFPAAWTEKLVRWKVALPGAGHSSPVLWGERIFLTSADPETGHRWLLCLDADSGKTLWERDYPFHPFHVHLQNGFATSTPVADGQRVYCDWATPEEYLIVALDHQGKEAWRRDLGPFISEHGFGSSPMLHDGLLFATNDQDGESSLVALRAADGSIAWQVARRTREKQNTSYAVPCIYTPPGGRDELIVNSWAYGVSAIDPRSGETLWESPVFERRPVGSPVLAAGLIFGNCGEGSGANTLIALKPPAAGASAPEVVYKVDKSSAPYVPTVVAAGDLLFLWGDKGVVTCIEASSGAVHWRQRVGGGFSGSPVRVGDKIFAISVDGEVLALAASKKYRLLGRTPLGESGRATPAVVGDRMYLRTASHLTCVENDLPGR